MKRALLLFLFLLFPAFAHAQSVSDLQSQIDAHNSQIASLETDILAYQKQLDALGTTKNTLQSAINSLSLSQKQLAAQIKVTQNKIAAANLQIQELTLSIGNKESLIASDEAAIGKALEGLAERDATPLVATLLSTRSLGEAWQAADAAVELNRALDAHISELEAARAALADNRDKVSAAKAELVSLAADLALQKKSVDANKAAQTVLLAQTKNQEANYQKLLADKVSAEKVFEQELADLEGQLNLIVHPGLLPKVGSGVLSWPFSLAFMQNCAARHSLFKNFFCITQYFGNTPFTTANPQIYNSMGHDGLDIGAAIGTPVRAALTGSVLGTGNTDLAHDSRGRQCYSFGKWVMVEHGNGLSTLYAHLSEIDVAAGQSVATGEVLGLSGMTGYATGPHLHFGVYATEGTEILNLSKWRSSTGQSSGSPCTDGGAIMPVATKDAYLNPLSYL
ncbi:peptidoglycan DD-metalloendopeptidase family protein [Candidatus Kaiserbacteria bacterium]|nr:peptidoglycan DD-metalloendopeptidase family protein [Candidatus Kaiserbacteria bacterium]